MRVADSHKDHEADLVVLMPGVVVVEVKGSRLWVEDGAWFIDRGQGAERIDPVAQARDARVLAHTDLDDGFTLPDLPRWQVSGRGDLAEVGPRVFGGTPQRLRGQAQDRRPQNSTARPTGSV